MNNYMNLVARLPVGLQYQMRYECVALQRRNNCIQSCRAPTFLKLCIQKYYKFSTILISSTKSKLIIGTISPCRHHHKSHCRFFVSVHSRPSGTMIRLQDMWHASAHLSTCGLRRLMSADITAAAEAPAIVLSPRAFWLLRPSIYFCQLQKLFQAQQRGRPAPALFAGSEPLIPFSTCHVFNYSGLLSRRHPLSPASPSSHTSSSKSFSATIILKIKGNILHQY